MFGHEKFEAYQISIQFLKVANKLLDKLPRGNAHIKDQLKRAAISIPLNIAEGSGKTEKNERFRFYSIARGSTMECAAVCDVIEIMDNRFQGEVEEAKELLERVAKILTAVCVKKG